MFCAFNHVAFATELPTWKPQYSSDSFFGQFYSCMFQSLGLVYRRAPNTPSPTLRLLRNTFTSLPTKATKTTWLPMSNSAYVVVKNWKKIRCSSSDFSAVDAVWNLTSSLSPVLGPQRPRTKNSTLVRKFAFILGAGKRKQNLRNKAYIARSNDANTTSIAHSSACEKWWTGRMHTNGQVKNKNNQAESKNRPG